MRILAISGSLRRDSHNSALLRAAATLLPPGVDLSLYDGLREIPPYDDDHLLLPVPAAVGRLRDETDGADAVLIATPEYNRSIPGQLKNALDWLSRPLGESPLRNKPVAVIGASTGMFGAVWAQAELRKVLATAGARVVNRELAIAAADVAFTADGRLVEAEHHDELASILEQLVAEAQPRFAPGA